MERLDNPDSARLRAAVGPAAGLAAVGTRHIMGLHAFAFVACTMLQILTKFPILLKCCPLTVCGCHTV